MINIFLFVKNERDFFEKRGSDAAYAAALVYRQVEGETAGLGIDLGAVGPLHVGVVNTVLAGCSGEPFGQVVTGVEEQLVGNRADGYRCDVYIRSVVLKGVVDDGDVGLADATLQVECDQST